MANTKHINIFKDKNIEFDPMIHKSTDTRYGVGNATEFGHLKLSDSTSDNTSDKTKGIAATPKAVNTLKNEFLDISKRTDTTSTFYKMMKLIYPVGCLYWSSSPTDPKDLFGGTWKQIKDRFVYAKGDNSGDVDSTGGTKTETLTTAQIPSHLDYYTTTGSITLDAHSHTMAHTHTSAGSVSSSFSGTADNTGNGTDEWSSGCYNTSGTGGRTSTADTTPSFSGTAATIAVSGTAATDGSWQIASRGVGGSGRSDISTMGVGMTNQTGAYDPPGFDNYRLDSPTSGSSTLWSLTTYDGHTHSVSASGSYTPSGSVGAHSHEFNHIHYLNNDHTHSYTPSGTVTSTFTGGTSSQPNNTNTGETTVTGTFSADRQSTETTGETKSHNNMPPYVVKYCWERTA